MIINQVLVTSILLLRYGYRHKMRNMEDELGRKLRSLRIIKGARDLKPAPTPPRTTRESSDWQEYKVGLPADRESGDIGSLLPGSYIAENELGACLVLDHVYPADYRHGSHTLDELLAQSIEAPVVFYRDHAWQISPTMSSCF